MNDQTQTQVEYWKSRATQLEKELEQAQGEVKRLDADNSTLRDAVNHNAAMAQREKNARIAAEAIIKELQDELGQIAEGCKP